MEVETTEGVSEAERSDVAFPSILGGRGLQPLFENV